MDTDDLTEKAYQALIVESGKISEFLQVEIGAAASRYRDENTYLEAMQTFVRHFSEHPGDHLDYWNLSDEEDPEDFGKKLAGLADRILQVIKTPIEERGPTFEERP